MTGTDITPATPGDGNTVSSTHQSAIETRAQVAAQRAAMTRTVQAMQEQQDTMRADLEKKRNALLDEMHRQTRELQAQMAPMIAEMKKMKEVLWTVNLYLGRDETLEMLRDGEPADTETPITIRQKVLVMSEESLLLVEGDQTGVDYRNIDTFTTWLLDAPENLDRILPEPKGVVVMIPTRVPSRSGNMFEDAAKDSANESSYWLLRNGQRLYLLTVDPELRIRDRIMPLRNEFTEVFDQRLFGYRRASSEPLEPGSEEWMKLEDQADAKRRHYMRVMMVLQGIIDRTTAWQPTFPSGVNLLSVEAQNSGKVVLIQDDEDSLMIGDGVEPFRDYQKRLNQLLRPGLRVIGNWFMHQGNNQDGGESSRIHPKDAQGLDRDVPYLLEERRGAGFVIRFKRTDKVYRSNVPVEGEPGMIWVGEYPTEALVRASYRLFPDDLGLLPYDLVTVPELERYLSSREERSKHFLSMVPVIKSALAAKREEAATEAPFRVLLEGSLINAGADPEGVGALLDELVHWWKLKNTWSKPLNGEPQHEGRALTQIVAEFTARQKAAARPDITEDMIAAGRGVEGAICVAQNRQGKWFAYTPARDDEDVFLHITPIRRNGTLGTVKEWASVPQRSASLLNVAWSTDRWGAWMFSANPRHYLTGPEHDLLVDQVLERADGKVLGVAEFHKQSEPDQRGFASYTWTTGTPATAEVSPSQDPLRDDGWRRRDTDLPVVAKSYRVVKNNDGVTLKEGFIAGGYSGGLSDSFSRYGSSYFDKKVDRWGSTPWPSDEPYKRRDGTPFLVWADEPLLDEMQAWRLRCEAAYNQQEAVEKERNVRIDRHVRAVNRIVMGDLEAQAKARFREDFGDAEDLWESHLKTLRLQSPVAEGVLHSLFLTRDKAGLPFEGESLGDLARFAFEDDTRRREEDRGFWKAKLEDMHGYEHVVVPEVPHVQE